MTGISLDSRLYLPTELDPADSDKHNLHGLHLPYGNSNEAWPQACLWLCGCYSRAADAWHGRRH